MMEEGGAEQQKIALEYLKNDNLLEQAYFLEKLKKEKEKSEVKDLDAILKFFKELESQNGKQRIAELARSKNYEERALAVHLIASDIGQDHHRLFRDLLKDINPEVRRSAISILAEKDWPEYWPRLIENLEIPEYHSTAYSTILQIGEPILPSLEQIFYKSGFSFEMLSEIIRIFGTIGGPKAQEYLLKKISYPDNRVVKRALIALRASDFKPEEHQKGRIKEVIKIPRPPEIINAFGSSLSEKVSRKREVEEISREATKIPIKKDSRMKIFTFPQSLSSRFRFNKFDIS